jgi:endonuclease/exonuclease/phosphatase family metal-dependent hydrolase
VVRVATFNIWELSGKKLDETDAAGHGTNVQLRKAAEIIQRVRPDILLVNEIDFDADHRANAAKFRDRYLKVGQNDQTPIDYPHVFFEPVNTGLPSGHDFDNDGRTDGPADAYGFGQYPGQYGMALFSRFPIDAKAARTFQNFLWKDMPGHHMPDGQQGRPPWYSPDEAAIFRLSSKSHWDVPVQIGRVVVHVLASHPTPPVFDGPEDRNGRRAFDEIRMLADYVSGGPAADYLVDDQGGRGGLAPDALFVILGDLNADPFKDSRAYGIPAIDQLLKHPRVQDPAPISPGAVEGGSAGAPQFRERRTCDFGRIDYVLPCKELTVRDSGVFWPAADDPLGPLVNKPNESSDHRLVWVDVTLPTRGPAKN